MDYREARAYMKTIERYGSVPGLDTVRQLLRRLNNPQNACRLVQIAGTNGKGSTGAFLAAILKAAGIRAGRFCSPAVFCERETISFDGEMITEEEFASCMEPVYNAAQSMAEEGLPHPTVFEVETAVAYLFFSRKAAAVSEDQVLAVVEAGMGGALDATNVTEENLLAVLTSISMDHMSFLGDSLKEIAVQKAGIIKRGGMAVTAPQRPEVFGVLSERCREMDVNLLVSDPKKTENMDLGLSGPFQRENAALALEAAYCLRQMGYRISDAAIERGLAGARWPGRFQKLGTDPDVWVDGAHNPDGVCRLCEAFKAQYGNRKAIMIAGIFQDKAAEEMVSIMSPYMRSLYTVTPKGPRGMPAETLKDIARRYCPCVTACGSVEEALKLAIKEAGKEGVVLSFGSLSYLHQVKEAYDQYAGKIM